MSVLGLCCCSMAFSSCGEQGLLSSCSVWHSLVEHKLSACGLQWLAFPCGTQAFGMWASVVAACKLSSCDSQA